MQAVRMIELRGVTMAIPLAQLESWSHQGAVATSRDTYQSIRSVLCDSRVPYADKNFEVYLQGSYGNDTNIFSESDVDVVIQLNSTFNSNKHELPQDQLALHERDYGPATYTASDFRKDVISVLENHYGIHNVTDGKKSVKLAGVSSRRNADIVVCTQYRKYTHYWGSNARFFVEGMMINNQGESTINYPRLHAAALTQKHQQTSNRFKPLIRVLKNIKTKMVENGYIDEKTAASYYIEGWLYNAPNDLFSYDLRDRFEKVCNWLLRHDPAEFVMPHGQFSLIGTQNNQWASNNLELFSERLIDFDRRY